ncbi:hypothetical protein [Bradyrhizobium genosp. P]|uniref:hypothetical protein n=1 Tax=Bradyrhizobium genosp. P TaxID=83641 RepID=UPI003CE701E8
MPRIRSFNTPRSSDRWVAEERKAAFMWTVKNGLISARGGAFERFYVEDEYGTKLIFLGLVGRVEDAQEEFEYRRGDLSFEVLATRVDTNSRTVRDYYTVWLGMAFKGVSRRLSADQLTLDWARTIALDIKGALLVWVYRGAVADALSCHSPAHDVAFVMKQWDRWDAGMEDRWP